MRIHEQVTLPAGVEVDEGIAGLLKALWELGLRTDHSCQGTPAGGPMGEHDGAGAYISFPQASDAFSFFSQTLNAISSPDRLAQIVVDVRLLTRAGSPGWRSRKRGPAVSLELSVKQDAEEPNLSGRVRFDPDLMPEIEAAFVTDSAPVPSETRLVDASEL